MTANFQSLKKALVSAVVKTFENMAFEQPELIEGDPAEYMAGKNNPQFEPQSAESDEGRNETDDQENSDNTEKFSLSVTNTKATGNDGEKDSGEILWASIPILKPLRGEMVLSFPDKYAEFLTRNIYGCLSEDGSVSMTVNDAIAEIINTISGCFVQELLPKDVRFELGLPNTGWGDLPTMEEKAINLSFDIGGNLVSAVVGGGDFIKFEDKIHQLQEKVS